jgi:GT2 family glycosyltransferase
VVVKRIPPISIGLPVYNGERYLEESLRSILSQTYEDFTLIISDNASTDRTHRGTHSAEVPPVYGLPLDCSGTASILHNE